MESFNQLESTIKHLLARNADPGAQAGVKEAFQIARAELFEQRPGLKIITVKDIRPQDVMNFWKLGYNTNSDKVWQLELEEKRGVPETLRPILYDYEIALGDADEVPATIQARLDAILLAAIAIKKREARGIYNEGKALHWKHDKCIEFPWVYQNKPRIVRGTANYLLSTGSSNLTDTTLVVVMAEERGLNAEYQVLSNLAMIWHSNKKAGKMSRAIYGIATDTYTWCFIQLNHDAKARRPSHTYPASLTSTGVDPSPLLVGRTASRDHLASPSYHVNRGGYDTPTEPYVECGRSAYYGGTARLYLKYQSAVELVVSWEVWDA